MKNIEKFGKCVRIGYFIENFEKNWVNFAKSRVLFRRKIEIFGAPDSSSGSGSASDLPNLRRRKMVGKFANFRKHGRRRKMAEKKISERNKKLEKP